MRCGAWVPRCGARGVTQAAEAADPHSDGEARLGGACEGCLPPTQGWGLGLEVRLEGGGVEVRGTAPCGGWRVWGLDGVGLAVGVCPRCSITDGPEGPDCLNGLDCLDPLNQARGLDTVHGHYPHHSHHPKPKYAASGSGLGATPSPDRYGNRHPQFGFGGPSQTVAPQVTLSAAIPPGKGCKPPAVGAGIPERCPRICTHDVRPRTRPKFSPGHKRAHHGSGNASSSTKMTKQ